MVTDVLVLGANGLLGSNIITAVEERKGSAAGTYHSTEPTFSFDSQLIQFDICATDAFYEILDATEPRVVINCAAMTDVDACETNRQRAHEINAEAPGRLASICLDQNIAFVHISTDYVFAGDARTAYDETVEPNPIQVYGQSKLAGERAVAAAHDRPLQARLSFVWGRHRSENELVGFPAWVRDRLEQGKETPLFVDQHITPTRAGAAAEAILDLVEANCSGLFHVAARSCITPYEFGRMLCQYIEAGEDQLTKGNESDVDRSADRPRYTCLAVDKIETVLERPQPTIADDLEAVSSLL